MGEVRVALGGGVNKATLFRDGSCEVVRFFKITLPEGTGPIVTVALHPLPPSCRTESISVSASIAVLSTGHRLAEEEVEEADGGGAWHVEVAALQKRLESKRQVITELASMGAAMSTYISNCAAASAAGSAAGVVSVEHMQQALDLGDARSRASAADSAKLYAECCVLEDEIRKKMAAKRGGGGGRATEVVVRFRRADAPSDGVIGLELRYMTTGAQWTPAIRLTVEPAAAADDDTTVVVTYSANIVQNTGEDWGDVRELVLSTATPTSLTTPIKAVPRVISLGTPPHNHMLHVRPTCLGAARSLGVPKGLGAGGGGSADGAGDSSSFTMTDVFLADATPYMASVTDGALTGDATYTLTDIGSIPSHASAVTTLQIATFDLKAELVHYIQPRSIGDASPPAYWLATMLNTSPNVILASNDVRVIAGGTLLSTRSRVGNVLPGQEFSVFLATATAIDVRRVATLSTKRDASGESTRESHRRATTVKNNGGAVATIVIAEPCDHSTDAAIKVVHADTDCDNAQLADHVKTWRKTLKPGEETTVVSEYVIVYPQERTIIYSGST
jgi:uncharacterized protein (TIGR02231 family)